MSEDRNKTKTSGSLPALKKREFPPSLASGFEDQTHQYNSDHTQAGNGKPAALRLLFNLGFLGKISQKVNISLINTFPTGRI